MRAAFLGSPPFAAPVFKRLTHSQHPIVVLVTRPDRPRGRGLAVEASALVRLAGDAGVPVLQPETTKTAEFLDELAAFEPDVLVVASYGEILKQELIELAPQGAFNVHASLLPRWRGASPIQRSILAGDLQTGVSIQRLVLALDQGDVLLAKSTPIDPAETAGDLGRRLASLGAEALVEALDLLAEGRAGLTPQDHDRATYAKKLTKEDGEIDWSRPAEEIARMVRALNPWPLARTTLPGGRALTVLRARVPAAEELSSEERRSLESARPGAVLAAGGLLRIATGEGVLEATEVKPAGKGAMNGSAFMRGARLTLDDVLGT